MPLNLSRKHLVTFAPDRDPTEDGVLVDANGFVPTMKGFRTLPAKHRATDFLPERAVGAAVLTFPDGTQFVAAGTDGFLASIDSGAVDIVTPGAWTLQDVGSAGHPLDHRWRFAYYQDKVFAVDGVHTPMMADQASFLSGSPWTPVPDNPPTASLVASSDFSLFMVDANSATWWSTLNPAIWASGTIQTETVHDTIDQTPGKITAAKALRSNMVLYKRSSIFVGQLVGPPLIWSFTEISRQVGAVSQESVVDTDDVHYFVSGKDWYSLDGFSLTKLPNQHREWFFDQLSDLNQALIFGRYDSARTCIFWHWATRDDIDKLVATRWVALNTRTGQWSNGYDQVTASPSGIDPNTIETDQVGVTSGLFLSDNALYIYDRTGQGASPNSYLVSGDIGDRHNMFQLSRMRPSFTQKSGTPRLQLLSTYTPAGTYTPNTPVDLSADGWFNVLNTARLQRLVISTDDDLEIAADSEIYLRDVGNV